MKEVSEWIIQVLKVSTRYTYRRSLVNIGPLFLYHYITVVICSVRLNNAGSYISSQPCESKSPDIGNIILQHIPKRNCCCFPSSRANQAFFLDLIPVAPSFLFGLVELPVLVS